MFTLNNMRALLTTRPFVPFRLWLSDGGHLDVRSPEQVLPLRQYAIIALLDPNMAEEGYDRHATIWYLHVTRHEALKSGDSPFQSPSGPSSETPASV